MATCGTRRSCHSGTSRPGRCIHDSSRHRHASPRAGRAGVWVRINGLDTPDCDADLHAVVPARPDGIVDARAIGAAAPRALPDPLPAGDPPDSLPQQLKYLWHTVFRFGHDAAATRGRP